MGYGNVVGVKYGERKSETVFFGLLMQFGIMSSARFRPVFISHRTIRS